jgi:hypothetical protein
LEGRVTFGDIPRGIASALEMLSGIPGDTREALLAADDAARRTVREQFRC